MFTDEDVVVAVFGNVANTLTSVFDWKSCSAWSICLRAATAAGKRWPSLIDGVLCLMVVLDVGRGGREKVDATAEILS